MNNSSGVYAGPQITIADWSLPLAPTILTANYNPISTNQILILNYSGASSIDGTISYYNGFYRKYNGTIWEDWKPGINNITNPWGFKIKDIFPDIKANDKIEIHIYSVSSYNKVSNPPKALIVAIKSAVNMNYADTDGTLKEGILYYADTDGTLKEGG